MATDARSAVRAHRLRARLTTIRRRAASPFGTMKRAVRAPEQATLAGNRVRRRTAGQARLACRIVGLAVVVVGGQVGSAYANPVTNVSLDASSLQWVCVEAPGSPSMTLTLNNPLTHKTIATDSPPVGTTLCSGAPGASFRTSFAARYTSAATITITPGGGGTPLTVPVPYDATDTSDGGATVIVRVANLPDPSTLTISGGAPIAVTGGRYTTPAPIPGGQFGLVDTATVSGAAYSARFFSQEATFFASENRVGVDGFDPLGGPINVKVTSGGQSATRVITPRVGVRQLATRLPFLITSGAQFTVSQAGWFSHTATAPVAALTNDGFSVSTPTGTQARYNFSLALFNPDANRPAGDPLRCTQLGPATVVSISCGTPLPARYSVTVSGQPVAARDSLNVDETTLGRDDIEAQASMPGITGEYPSSFQYTTATPIVGPVRARIVRPAGHGYAAAAVTVSPRSQGAYDVNVGDDQSDVFRFTPGTRVTLFGPQSPTEQGVFNLDDAIVGDQVTGTAAANALIRVKQDVGGNGEVVFYFLTTAAANGQFAVTLSDPFAGDQVEVTAVDPATRTRVTDHLTVAAPPLRIIGLQDQQLVRGVIHASAPQAGIAFVEWGGAFGQALLVNAPFAFTADTRRVPDGPAFIEATATGMNDITAFDWVDVIVDNTPPRASLPARMTGRVNRAVRLDPDATDANGIGRIVVRWGDRKSLFLTGGAANRPFAHTYRHRGRFRITVAVFDSAGNRTLLRMRIRIT